MVKTLVLLIAVGALAIAPSLTVNAAMAPATRCKDLKAKATGRNAAALLKALMRNVKKPNVDKLQVDISRAQSRFTKAFNRADSRGGCENPGDAPAIESKTDAYAWAVITGTELCSSTTTTTTSTTSTTTIPPQCGTVAAPPSEPLNSTCRQIFPPAATIPCSIPTPGTQYYVDAAAGNDANSGTSSLQPWMTLCRAVSGAAPGSTIRVAAGTYLDGTINIGKGLTVKGGYDSTFTNWDPVANPTYFHGRLTLSHNAAVWGGFRMTGRPASSTWCDVMHTIAAGTLIDNYIEIIYTSLSDSTQCALLVQARPTTGAVARLACNDIYVRGESSQYTLGIDAVELYALGGDVMFDSNRVCLDNYANKWFAETVSGYGTCGSGTSVSTLTLTNNIIENAASGYAVGSFYGCYRDLNMVLTNNTIVTNGSGITGYAGEPGVIVDWKLTNNIVARSPSGSGSGIQVGDNPGVVIGSAEGNLIFGFADNGINPPPGYSNGNDTTGAYTLSSVFVGAAGGDFHLLSTGPGVGTGLNVYNLPAYGSVTVDLDQLPRSAVGPWDRSALGD